MRTDGRQAARGAVGGVRWLRSVRGAAGVMLMALACLSAGCRAEAESVQPQTDGDMVEFAVTAYCTGEVTQSGARVKHGMAAADPRVLPVGSTVRVEGTDDHGHAYAGIYTVTDTGRKVKGHILDLYMDDCAEAKAFGRRTMLVEVIRRGWDPTATE